MNQLLPFSGMLLEDVENTLRIQVNNGDEFEFNGSQEMDEYVVYSVMINGNKEDIKIHVNLDATMQDFLLSVEASLQKN
ncbi:hypothetical protein MK079_01205 [Candidatus Gracilibacteria bacterium]|nr:hypothetical protein [Candidatus Gracilibacteria bacterium]